MRHISSQALDRLEPLLRQLRRVDGIDEREPGSFRRGSSAFLHFHEDPEGLFADLKVGDEWVRHRVSTAAERRKLLVQLRGVLAT